VLQSPDANQAPTDPGLGEQRIGGLGCESVAAPQMMGDFLGYRVRRQVFVPRSTFNSVNSVTTSQDLCVLTLVPGPNLTIVTPALGCPPVGTLILPNEFGPGLPASPQTVTASSHIPGTTTTTTSLVEVRQLQAIAFDLLVATRGSFKIGENESPRPEDRVFINYNYYDHVPDGADSFGNVTHGRVHQETFGFEKTFLNGDASVGLRAPVLQQQADGGYGANDFGDLSIVLKYAFINDPQTGNVLSGGLVVTAPTGPVIVTYLGKIDSVLLQPWGGMVHNFGDRLYVQGFSSVVIPTETKDVTLLFNDLAIGYWLRRSASEESFVRTVCPTLEAHVTTPLNHRGSTGAISVPDTVQLTGAMHLGLGRYSLLSVGVVCPVTSPRPFDVAAMAQLNFLF
jgi:hypothetical protein